MGDARSWRVGLTLVVAAATAGMAPPREASRQLLAAAAAGEAARVSALLRQGADPDARDDAGRPALLVAAAAGRESAVHVLLHAGARPDATDRSGWSALHEAVQRGDLAVARALLDAGAAPDLRSRARGTPLDLAERGGQAALAALLRAHGARGSGKSIGDTVCVRPWRGDGYCATVEAVDATRAQLRVTRLVGCERGCAAEPACSGGRPVGAGGLAAGDALWVPFSCLTHTGLR
jgi:hypothetical protein